MFSEGNNVMNKNVCTEIVEFQVISGITDEESIKIVEYLEENFHSKQNGFIDTELVKVNEGSQWIMIQHWESIEESKEASKMMMKMPITENFRKSLNPKTVKIKYLNQVKKWKK